MLKPNRKYFPQQPTSGSWKCWCLPGMVSGDPPPRKPEPGTGSALCGPPRPGAAPGLARRLRLHGQGHTASRLPRPPWRRPRLWDRHTQSAVPSSDPASLQRSGPAHGVSPRPSPEGLSLHGAPPTPLSQPGSVLPEPRPCSRLRPQPSLSDSWFCPFPVAVLQKPRPRHAQDCP